MGLMEQLVVGREAHPRRIMLYGTHGIGKSTWAAGAPRPVFVQTERGLDDIGPPRFPLARTWADVMQALAQLYSAPHDFGKVRAGLEKAGLKPELAEITMKSVNEVAVTGEDSARLRRLLDALESLDDVQDVYTTAALDE